MSITQLVEVLSEFDDLSGKRVTVCTPWLPDEWPDRPSRVVQVVVAGGLVLSEDQAARLRDTLDRWLRDGGRQ